MQGRKAPSLAGRFAAAIALTIGFYALALGIALGLVAGPAYVWVNTGDGNLWITVSGILIGGSILVGLFPRRIPFTAPGPRIEPADAPALLAAVEEVARDAGQAPPDEIYATLQVNAAVTEVGGGLGGRRRRVLIIGLPLLHVLSERGVRGVIAHELGHYAGGDTRLGPWIWRTRDTIERTIDRLGADEESLGRRLVRVPFIWYGNAFLRITQAISRREEFAADAFAAREVGRDAYCAALRQLFAFGPAFDSFWSSDVVPALRSRLRPPVLDGFARFTTAEGVLESAERQLQERLAEARADAYASHPAAAERLAALAPLPAGPADDSGPAIALLADAGGLEARALEGIGIGEDFAPVRWEEAGERVWLEQYRRTVHDRGGLLAAFGVEDVAALAADPAPLARSLQQEAGEAAAIAPREYADGYARHLLACALTLRLVDAGGRVDAAPGEPVAVVLGDRRITPGELIDGLASERSAREAWPRTAAELGLAGARLGARREVAVAG